MQKNVTTPESWSCSNWLHVTQVALHQNKVEVLLCKEEMPARRRCVVGCCSEKLSIEVVQTGLKDPVCMFLHRGLLEIVRKISNKTTYIFG